ncbi:phosphopantothenoylcysteine decarboxylase [Methanobrevibacter sp.]|uniref:phosphopantothenoylcysteine decarboxylase domain-containing protein n=1 Tax=Methanobrevibacter sp. TaxID=66852 RepID=UPI0025D19CCA|nr:phosphopantothenoylcysteine decarboxylase [Methanobrevibacter sp.]MBR4447372.1 phosphopantothenoylcysteine synthase [Methanobrevibacter sp.]
MIKGKKILISLGGTYEPIDSVRGITNKSSGKMGLALAREAYIRGADLTLVVANVSVEIPSVFNVIRVETSSEMNEAILSIISDFDIFISTAAVSDFEVTKKSNKKIDSSSSLSLNLKPTIKIIRQIKEINPDIFLVGFKAEFNISKSEMIECARKQIENAGTDLVIANDISNDNCHFGSDNNEVLIVDDDVITIPLASKREIAKSIFDIISEKV